MPAKLSSVAAKAPARKIEGLFGPKGGVRPDRYPPEGYVRHSAESATIDILADTWTYLIIREGFFGARRFAEFQRKLAIPRATLSKRLERLQKNGIFKRTGKPGRHKQYQLTERGRDVYPITLGMMWFGDKWMCDGTPPLALFHKTCRSWFSARVVWRETGEPVQASDIRIRIPKDYWIPRPKTAPRHRRSSWDGSVQGRRPCSVERMLSIVGDRWTFLVLQELFHGNHRFDDFINALLIAPSVLSGRLINLQRAGFIEKNEELGGYHLTKMGLDSYGPMILMKVWGEKWVVRGERSNFDFVHPSGGIVTPVAVCSSCSNLLSARDVSYVCNYVVPD
ncbi:transcriptional regulator [Bradyrhizobium pachyrhizi]|uniref:Transcriptional regulator n=1 Tax=Bradyrhizobium pachyrhizi TaxID=280333 RepID=A0A844SKV8_9BRAD|nr:helix-turn-helix domain-containing protein [Bradyrhizobium pachyrhizi]MVT64699.1 transcriptional regulator [Bradyrhizobium pachyrhizi]